mmetsp:Transcript_32959/g.77688  ORF Transcript_32959/g.77688 Transcript_32959/m.77688 type:complete len:153 (+) Transcript_32959:159-617(+)
MAAPALWYLGIGSMMNPQKFIDRGMKPLESRPVLCVDFVRRFWGKFGMAEIREQKGAEFHAVVHRMSLEDMAKLDKMERGYIRKDIVCFTYDGTRIVASGYQFDLATIMFNGHTPPSERYLNLMVSGMEYYGCDPAAIQEMRATPTQGPGSR